METPDEGGRGFENDGSKYNCVVTFYHDVEQNIDSNSDIDKCRDALKEVLKIEEKNGISTTYNIVGKLFVEQSDMIDRVIKSGNEVAFHSYNHQNNWKSAFYANEIKLCREMSSQPIGYRSPRSQWNLSTINALLKYRFKWSAEIDAHSEPYFIRNRLMRLPISQDDWLLYQRKISFKNWRQKFQNGIQQKNYYAIGTHDYILSEGEDFIENWEKIIEISNESNVFVVSFTQAVDLYIQYINNENQSKNKKTSIIGDGTHTTTSEIYPISKIKFENTNPKFPITRNSINQMMNRIKKGFIR